VFEMRETHLFLGRRYLEVSLKTNACQPRKIGSQDDVGEPNSPELKTDLISMPAANRIDSFVF
jgi:hypothetical protein